MPNREHSLTMGNSMSREEMSEYSLMMVNSMLRSSWEYTLMIEERGGQVVTRSAGELMDEDCCADCCG